MGYSDRLLIPLALLFGCGQQVEVDFEADLDSDESALSVPAAELAPATAASSAGDIVALRSRLMSAPLSVPRIYIGEGAAQPDLPPGGLLRLRARVRADSSDRESRYWLAEALRRDRDYSGAEEHFREAIRLGRGHIASYIGLARSLKAVKRYDDAAATLDDAAEAAPHTAELHFLRGALASHQERYEQAAAAFRLAADMDSTRDRVHFELAEALLRQGSTALALAALRQGLDHIPDSIGLRLRLAQLLSDSADYEAALEQVALVTEAYPSLTPAYVAMARVHRRRHDLIAAREAIDAGMEIDPLKIDLSAERGILLMAEGRETEAIPYLEKAVFQDPDLLEAVSALGQAYERTGAGERAQLVMEYVEHLSDHESELRQLKTAIALDQSDGAAFLAIGNLYSHLVRSLAAAQALEVGLQIVPDDIESLGNLALVFLGTRQLPRAVETYEHVLALDSTVVSAHANLGAALAISGEYDRALVAFQRAVTLEPDFAQAHMGMARVYEQLGRAEKAAAAMAEFRRLRKSSPGMTGD